MRKITLNSMYVLGREYSVRSLFCFIDFYGIFVLFVEWVLFCSMKVREKTKINSCIQRIVLYIKWKEIFSKTFQQLLAIFAFILFTLSNMFKVIYKNHVSWRKYWPCSSQKFSLFCALSKSNIKFKRKKKLKNSF